LPSRTHGWSTNCVNARTTLPSRWRTLRKTQDRLVQTQKLASLGQLTAGIAHEIKIPLNFVNNLSAVSVILIGELQEATQSFLSRRPRRETRPHYHLQRSFDPGAGQADVFPQDITRVLFNPIPNGFYAATKRKNTIDSEGFQPTVAAVTRSLGIALRSGFAITRLVPIRFSQPSQLVKTRALAFNQLRHVKQHSGSIEVDTQPGV
jgi:hypothetical protein